MTHQGLTPKTMETLQFIKGYYDKWGFVPTIEEIRVAMNLKSISSAWERYESLMKRGYLEQTKFKARGYKIV